MREEQKGTKRRSQLPVEEEGLLERTAEAGLLVAEPRAGAAMLSGAVDAGAPVQVLPVAFPLVDVPGREPQEGQRVREGQRVSEGQEAQDGDRRRERHRRQEGPLRRQRQRPLPAAAGNPGMDRHGR